jgi:fatty-acyl-CoA synthase
MDRFPQLAPDHPLLIKNLLLHSRCWSPEQLIHYREHAHSYAEFHARIARVAGLLRRLGVQPGDAVGVMDWDSHRYLEFFFAVPMCGAVLHTVNIRLSPEQILYTINHAADVVLFAHDDFLSQVAKLKPSFTTPCQVVRLSEPGAAVAADSYEALLAREPATFDFPDLNENTVATTFYTTGTTGEPKGVFFTHRQLVLHTLGVGLGLAAFGDPFSFRQEDVYMPLTPMFHVHAWGMPFIATLLGVKQIYPGRYEPERLVRLLVEHKVTVTHGVPTILHMLLTQAVKDGVRFDGLKMLVGGSALSRGLCERAMERGIKLTTGYGMSETCPILSVSRIKPSQASAPAEERMGLFTATGFPMPLVDARIRHTDGTDLPAGTEQIGELVVRAPWLTAGYSRNPEASRELWRDGWLHTGDVAYRDEAGYLHITDRLKDVIKSGGEWVSSLELESLLSQHAMVSEVAVVGTKDERWGERPVAFVVLRAGESPAAAPDQLRDHLLGFVSAGKLQRWAVPEEFRFVADLPKTSVGKLNKRAMRAALAQS